MNLRHLLVILLLANAGFAAWALFVDRPVERPAAGDISHLRRLVLAGEAGRAGGAAVGGTGQGGGAQLAIGSGPSGGAQPAGGTGQGGGNGPTADVGQGAAAAAAAVAGGTVAGAGATVPAQDAGSRAAATPAAARCVTVGPFDELRQAAAAAALLKRRGFAPRQRDERGDDLIEYWVYADGFQSDAAEASALKALHAQGVDDVRVMPAGDKGRRLSLGLFAGQSGAARRVREIHVPGVTPQIEERHHAQATYWVDLDLQSAGQAVPTDGLLPDEAPAGAHLEIRSCPAPAVLSPPESTAIPAGSPARVQAAAPRPAPPVPARP